MCSMEELDTLRREPVEFVTAEGSLVRIEAVVQDTMPSGSTVGTVVGTHGVPGSHKDYKYVEPHLYEKGIRFIGINYPGFGISGYNDNVGAHNETRNAFVRAVVEKLGVTGRIVYIGHSRGCENALQLATHDKSPAHAVVLLNPTGFRPHSSIRPIIKIRFLLWMTMIFPTWISHPVFLWIFQSVFRKRMIKTGETAEVAVRTMNSLYLDGQRKYVQKLKDNDTRAVVLYSPLRDQFIDEAISHEFADSFPANRVKLTSRCASDLSSVQCAAVSAIEAGEKSVTVAFDDCDHYIQRHRPEFVAACLEALLQ